MKPTLDKPIQPQWIAVGMRAGAIVLAVAGVGSLVTATVRLVLLDCPMSFIIPLFWGGLGLGLLSIDAVLLAVTGLRTGRWKGIGTALSFMALGMVFFYYVIVPWAAEQRRARHQRQMTDVGVPLLNAIVVSVEASRAKAGKLPADQNGLHEVIDERDFNRLDNLRCCWGIDYTKLNARHYELRYWAMDIEYVYESRKAVRGWHAVNLSE